MAKVEYTTQSGVKFVLKPISRFMLDRLVQSKPKVERPTYEIELPGGAKETHLHDADTLQTPEDKERWAEYMKQFMITELEFTRKYWTFVVNEGIEVEVPQDGRWLKNLEQYGITVDKTSMHSLKMEYVYSLLTGPEEFNQVVSEVLRISGSDPEAVTLIRESFRPALQGKTDRQAPPKEQPVDVHDKAK